MRDQYVTVAGEGAHETEVSRSRFVCLLAPAATEEEARSFVRRARGRHPAATHHCYAYVIGADAGIQKCDDDGEPGGTAGAPMLQMLNRRGVRQAVAVVARYFGGTKLGAGGLIRAYGGAVGEALDTLGTVTRQRLLLATVTVGHQQAGRLENGLRSTGRNVRHVTYGSEVTIEIGIPASGLGAFRDWLADTTAGSARLELGGDTYSRPAAPRSPGGGTGTR
ncbi:YigZ family protein [Streptomyces sp. ACA25]|uniref:YigZ family protein n=1 Tax=Streptomyces sp. ACA25 TaxID=3022596 RepID=UPI002308118D|nr:YigZ family protein [Streptomyces sp. ACA25]MDB1089410.1 YigZ family protein [Streptomyces sp. ACA25]